MQELSTYYAGRNPLLVGVLTGAYMFMADLSRVMKISLDVEFMAVSSYGLATQTSGVVRILKDLDTSIEGREVLIVEDIIDSGLTLELPARYSPTTKSEGYSRRRVVEETAR